MTCNTQCATCFGPQNSQCTACSDGFVLSGNDCTQGCPVGKYLDNGKCITCDSSCGDCSQLPTRCIACPKGTYLKDTQCVAASGCPDGTYANPDTNTCAACNDVCKTCSTGAATDCVNCKDSLFRFGNQCMQNCPNGTYKQDKTCTTCHDNCSSCDSDSFCTGCNEGFVLQETSTSKDCVANCADGYYNDNNVCTKCTAGCSQCSSTSDNGCSTCADGYLKTSTGGCQPGCAPGKYLEKGACLTCSEGCSVCVSASTCSSCDTGLLL
jgi:proprotein convertase subtilisin/kexin type 5